MKIEATFSKSNKTTLSNANCDLELYMIEIALLPLTLILCNYCYCDDPKFATRDASRMLTYEASYPATSAIKKVVTHFRSSRLSSHVVGLRFGFVAISEQSHFGLRWLM